MKCSREYVLFCAEQASLYTSRIINTRTFLPHCKDMKYGRKYTKPIMAVLPSYLVLNKFVWKRIKKVCNKNVYVVLSLAKCELTTKQTFIVIRIYYKRYFCNVYYQ